ncbi:putative RDD family membrane protein YckC [Arcticibacter pallidicorallinus]|uniref:Putative RDD family membrane protein YckC n=1 Tax=Arcticibacter pallidicorallinus TaxID=1259464 RepID=A0A2T0TUY7_9SPHI|nr:RDD family protein [Arcticibacter pallidicorallinus]PRY49473.1 putative RDD family membrane protein YckC [Arcticibacter pallidicorallinus]
MEDAYIVVIEGKPQGPFSLTEMKSMNLMEGTFVKREGMSDYKEAHEIPELCELLGFRLTRAEAQYFASPDIRMLAALIDYGIILTFYLVIVLIVVSFIDAQYLKVAVTLSFLPVIPVVKFVMNVFMEASSRKGTFGKALLGIKVIRVDAEKMTLTQSFARNLYKLVSTLSLGVGYLAGFFDKRQQCWHDRLARTLVVKDRLL